MPPRPKKLEEVPELAQKIRKLRESRSESQTQFASVLGTLPSAVSKWEAGRNRPNPEIFVRLARISEGQTKRYFLDQAGIGFKEEGSVDFQQEHWTRRLRERAVLVPNTSESKGYPLSQNDRAVTPLDPELLVFVIETIDKELKQRGKKLPSRKYAELVAICYDFCHKTGQRDSETIERFLKIA